MSHNENKILILWNLKKESQIPQSANGADLQVWDLTVRYHEFLSQDVHRIIFESFTKDKKSRT